MTVSGGHAMFADRGEAGRKLAARLSRMHIAKPIVYALPRGGVPVAAEIARDLHAPLELIPVRKIGTPGDPEVALGAVVDGAESHIFVDHDFRLRSGADDAYIERAAAEAVQENERRRSIYRIGSKPIDPAGHVAIVVDDGIATGATMLAAVSWLSQRGAVGIYVAVPVAPRDRIGLIARRVDAIVCLHPVDDFEGVGSAYEDFHQLTDAEVMAGLKEARSSRRVRS
jgi:predicted phosphoribosyltransferase